MMASCTNILGQFHSNWLENVKHICSPMAFDHREPAASQNEMSIKVQRAEKDPANVISMN